MAEETQGITAITVGGYKSILQRDDHQDTPADDSGRRQQLWQIQHHATDVDDEADAGCNL